MQLTAQEFAKLVTSMKADPRHDDRRENPRIPARSRVDIVPVTAEGDMTGATRLSVIVRDISRNGFGFVAPREFAPQSRAMIVLPNDPAPTIVLLLEVVRCVQKASVTFIVGAKMLRRVSGADYTGYLLGLPAAVANIRAA